MYPYKALSFPNTSWARSRKSDGRGADLGRGGDTDFGRFPYPVALWDKGLEGGWLESRDASPYRHGLIAGVDKFGSLLPPDNGLIQRPTIAGTARPFMSGVGEDTRAGVVAPLLLQLEEISVPHLVRSARIPGVRTEGEIAQVADLIALRREPGVEQGISYRFRYLVTRYACCAVGGFIIVRRRLRRKQAVRCAAIRHMSVNDRVGSIADKAMVATVLRIGA